MQSPTLCNLVGTDDFSQVAKLREQEIRLFQCFLDTRLMISRPENPNPLREDEEVLELVPGGGHRRKKHRRNIKMMDPLHQLFLPEETQRIGMVISLNINPCLLNDVTSLMVLGWLFIPVSYCFMHVCIYTSDVSLMSPQISQMLICAML